MHLFKPEVRVGFVSEGRLHGQDRQAEQDGERPGAGHRKTRRREKVLCVRPKQALAGDGNYREPRWFARWSKPYTVEPHELPAMLVVEPDAPRAVPFGDVFVKTLDTSVGVESCEELFAPETLSSYKI